MIFPKPGLRSSLRWACRAWLKGRTSLDQGFVGAFRHAPQEGLEVLGFETAVGTMYAEVPQIEVHRV